MVIDSTGNVGIGTAAPIGQFTVHNGTDGNTVITADAGEGRIMSLNDADNAYKPLKFYGSI